MNFQIIIYKLLNGNFGIHRKPEVGNPISNGGFTLIELIVSLAILLVIYTISAVGLSNVIPSTSQNTTYDALVSDLRLQQVRAMTTNSPFGIHFETNSYTFFEGPVYQFGAISNYVVNLDPTVNFNPIGFPGGEIVFSPGSGDVDGYIEGSDSVSIVNTQSGKTVIVKINEYGAPN